MSSAIASTAAATAQSTTPTRDGGGRRQSRTVVAVRVAIAVVGLIIMMFPMYWMLRTSVAGTDELRNLPVSLWPQDWVLENYVRPWQQYPFARWLGNSVFIAVMSVLLTLIINLAAGYAFAKLRFWMICALPGAPSDSTFTDEVPGARTYKKLPTS